MHSSYGSLDLDVSPHRTSSSSRKRRRCALAVCSALFVLVTLLCFMTLRPRLHALSNETPTPDAPRAPHALTINITKIHVKWDKTQQLVLYYRIRMCVPSNVNATKIIQVNTSDLDVIMDKLQANHVYCFAVAACNQAGCGYFSKESCFNTLPPTAPQTISKIVLMKSLPRSVHVAWNQVESNGEVVDFYQLQVAKRQSVLNWTNVYSDVALECYVGNLEPDTYYRARVRAHNKVGFSEWSPILDIHTSSKTAVVPSAPKNVKYEFFSAVPNVKISWNSPSSDGGADVTGYRVQIARDAGFRNIVNDIQTKSNDSLALFDNLSSEICYFVRILCENSVGAGMWSSALNFTIP